MRLERKTREYAYRLMTETNARSKGTIFLKGRPTWYVRLVRAFYVGPNVAYAELTMGYHDPYDPSVDL